MSAASGYLPDQHPNLQCNFGQVTLLTPGFLIYKLKIVILIPKGDMTMKQYWATLSVIETKGKPFYCVSSAIHLHAHAADLREYFLGDRSAQWPRAWVGHHTHVRTVPLSLIR